MTAVYDKTVTVFNRLPGAGGEGGDLWLPSVLEGVDLAVGRGASYRRWGAVSDDRALLGVRYVPGGDNIYVGGKLWLPPLRWRSLGVGVCARAVTFSGGESFDFFIPGCFEGGGIIADADYDRDGGFYAFMNRTRDDVFAVTSVSRFSLIPHFEVTGK